SEPLTHAKRGAPRRDEAARARAGGGVGHSLATLWCHRRSPNLTRLDSDFILKLAAVVSRTAARPGKTEVTDGPEHQVRPAARHGGARPVSLRRLLRPRAAPAAPRRVGPRHHRHVP